jgi:hypothetical protein
MGIHIGVVMTALEDIQLAITKLEASLEQDFMTDAVRDIMTTAGRLGSRHLGFRCVGDSPLY